MKVPFLCFNFLLYVLDEHPPDYRKQSKQWKYPLSDKQPDFLQQILTKVLSDSPSLNSAFGL